MNKKTRKQLSDIAEKISNVREDMYDRFDSFIEDIDLDELEEVSSQLTEL